MARTVFENSMVAHVWAQQDQKEARSHNGNFWFSGAAIYSYNTAIGIFLKPFSFKAIDKPIVFINNQTYSVTTSGKHMPAIWRALGYDNRLQTCVISGELMQEMAQFPYVFEGKGHKETLSRYIKADYARRFECARDLLVKASRARGRKEQILIAAKSHLDRAKFLARIFKVRLYIPKDLKTLDTTQPSYLLERVAGLSGVVLADRKAAIAKRARADKKRRVEELERNAKLMKDWIEGIGLYPPRGYERTPAGGVYMRKAETSGGKQELQTSQGASVPWGHAVRVFKALKAIRASGQAWQENGRTLKVGHFTVNRIEANGDFVAGCHTFKWADIEPFAIAQGVFDLEADDSAITQKEMA